MTKEEVPTKTVPERLRLIVCNRLKINQSESVTLVLYSNHLKQWTNWNAKKL